MLQSQHKRENVMISTINLRYGNACVFRLFRDDETITLLGSGDAHGTRGSWRSGADGVADEICSAIASVVGRDVCLRAGVAFEVDAALELLTKGPMPALDKMRRDAALMREAAAKIDELRQEIARLETGGLSR